MKLSRHKIISLLFAIGFVVVVQWFASPLPTFRFLVPAILIYIGAIAIYNWRYFVNRDQLDWWLALRNPILILIWFGLLFVVPSGFGRGVFLLVTIPIIFFFQTLLANRGQQLAWNWFLLSLAGLLLALYGFNFYFPLTGIVYLALVFIGVLFLVRIVVDSVPHPPGVKWLAGLVMALFAAEIFWVLQFLPLHFSVLAVLSFNILYLLWAIYYHYLYQTLTARQIQLNVLLALGLSLVILISSPWTIQG